jgi:DNA polymerase III subunit beta
MNFVISSTGLLSHLQAVSRVINSKNALPILDNFLFELGESKLIIRASDLETTLTATIKLENCEGKGVVAIDAKRLTDIVKEFPEQPLTFNIDDETLNVEIITSSGKFSIKGIVGEEFPKLPEIQSDKMNAIKVASEIVLNGISKTLFAAADDELRPVMNGIYVELTPDFVSFAASDSHKLVRYRRAEAKSEDLASFILPKKPAALLKNILPRVKGEVSLEFDDKNAFFVFDDFQLICRLIEGRYPSYNSVIPKNNPNKLTVDRIELYNTIKRVSVCSNQASNLVRLKIVGNQLTISAQDIDYSISAYEVINCQYNGTDMEIGFKSNFLVEIISNFSSTEIVLELSEPSRAGILVPADRENENEDILMLIMPMMLNN